MADAIGSSNKDEILRRLFRGGENPSTKAAAEVDSIRHSLQIPR
jgi:hypothetical protein